jgi:hypothetical protein
MTELLLIGEIAQLDEALNQHLRDLTGMVKDQTYAGGLTEGLAKLRSLLEERSRKVDELNKVREQGSA